jgi:hypothetical protein
MFSDISVCKKIVLAKGRHGRPRKVLISGFSPVILQLENTNPNGCESSNIVLSKPEVRLEMGDYLLYNAGMAFDSGRNRGQ